MHLTAFLYINPISSLVIVHVKNCFWKRQEKMKNKASVLSKQIMSVLSSVVKAKSLALKNKTSTIKTRLIILSMLKNKKVLFSSITHKLHALVGRQDDKLILSHGEDNANANDNDHEHGEQSSNNNAIVLFNSIMALNKSHYSSNPESCTELVKKEEEDDNDDDGNGDGDGDEEYPDLTHSLFDSELDELELSNPGGSGSGSSVIDLVRNSKEDGHNFSLEDEIDHVADLFITKFHRQIKMQKLDSFKRYREMLDRSV